MNAPTRLAVSEGVPEQRGPDAPAPLRTGLRAPILWGLVITGLLFGVLAVWAGTARIGGAVIAQGEAAVRGRPRAVQHLDGGIVAEIPVAEGERVAAGDVLLRLDPTVPALNLAMAEGRLAEALARRARLEAEHLGLVEPVFDWSGLPFAAPDTRLHEAGERQVFAARAEVLRGQRDRLTERLAQIESQLSGLTAQLAARRDQLSLTEADLETANALASRGLARAQQLSDLQRGRSELLGQIAALEAEVARARTAARDAELETLQAERAFREQVVTDLRTANAEIDALLLEIVNRRAQLDRIELRAPAAGIVHELAVTTPGAVIAPGGTVAQIIPLDEGVEFTLRVDPRAIDQVWPGQPAQVLVGSFDPISTPRLSGTVVSVPPAAVTDPRSGTSYYRIEVEVPAEELARLGAPLVPGMPVEAFLETSERTVLAYLVQPLRRHLGHAFRED
ncbi:MAG: HlyD family type I secretion periplasmic adaptor subunit [Gemmobacter sp.]